MIGRCVVAAFLSITSFSFPAVRQMIFAVTSMTSVPNSTAPAFCCDLFGRLLHMLSPLLYSDSRIVI
ncbi:hypothetical protein M758_UG156100 [Ceratodon purpureus]|nr:hypothetical protein M758_UG156100 [Ceratodon purpureus]